MDVSAWAAVGTIMVAVITMFGLLIRLMDRLNKAEGNAESAGLRALAVGAEVESLRRDFSKHELEVAKEYVSKEMLIALETRIVDAINRVGDRLDDFMRAKHIPPHKGV